eukprot:TRINITY_DN79868_c0_g1_i1.p1 TRINITY_DN79868_c0_g1~~TRINITY_DN79868_c0_g1_i1.p1  ORF type:complete len:253 (-),score=49.46 TRINITY_DN79868_c0_g1_i1:29-751(-)
MAKSSSASSARPSASGKATAPRRTVGKRSLSRKALASLVLQRPATGPSTKAVSADLTQLKRYLGRACPHFGKRGVIQLFAPQPSTGARSAGRSELPAGPPRFNKYAGWAEWKNAIFLWVNAVGGNFTNAFVRGGQEVSWYVGGQKPTEQSPIVKRLLAFSRQEAAEKNTKVIMFVRPRESEPYIVCGACTYVGHNDKKKGFEFKWQLRDFGALQKCSDFNRLMAVAKPSGRSAATAAKWA